MELASAQALLLVCKHHPVQRILLRAYKEEAREFARSYDFLRPDVQLQAPADQCRRDLDGVRCNGRVPELAVTQACALHQRTRRDATAEIVGSPADLNLNGARRMSKEVSGVFATTLEMGQEGFPMRWDRYNFIDWPRIIRNRRIMEEREREEMEERRRDNERRQRDRDLEMRRFNEKLERYYRR